MTAEEFLLSPSVLKADIAADMDNLAALRAVAESCTSHFDLVSGKKTGDSRGKLEDITVELADEEKKIQDKILSLVLLEKEVLDVIRKIPNSRQRAVVLMRYIQGMPWDKIRKEADISESYGFRLKKDALKSVERILENRKGNEKNGKSSGVQE